jgi:hypothetical protein
MSEGEAGNSTLRLATAAHKRRVPLSARRSAVRLSKANSAVVTIIIAQCSAGSAEYAHFRLDL